MNAASTPPATGPSRSWRRDPIVLLVLGVLALYVGVNGVMLWFSLHTSTDLVAKDYYARAERYGETQTAAAISRATGWRAQLSIGGTSGGSFALHVTGADGQPVRGLTGQVSAYRPSDAALDQMLTVEESADSPGTYLLHFTRPARGLWELTLELRGADGILDQRLRVVVP